MVLPVATIYGRSLGQETATTVSISTVKEKERGNSSTSAHPNGAIQMTVVSPFILVS